MKAALSTFGMALLALSATGGSSAEILWTKPICIEEGRYLAWPTICRRQSGELLVVFSGDRESHTCPYGKVQAIRSTDDGETWSKPETWVNDILDDRDAGVIELANGDLVLHYFNGVSFYCLNKDAEPRPECMAHFGKLPPKLVNETIGHFIRRSTDGGRSWSDPVRTCGQTPHGPILLANGRLMLVGRVQTWPGEYSPYDSASLKNAKHELPVEVSDDGGRTWRVLSRIVPPKDMEAYHEPHAVELPDGKIVAQFRCHAKGHPLMQCESTDGGRSWTTMHETGIHGLPPHLIRLADGRLLTVYAKRGERYAPEGETAEIGEYACLSDDGGRTWNVRDEVKLASHFSDDMGYPASCQLPDGTILTVYYQTRGKGVDVHPRSGMPQTCIWLTKWRCAK